MEAIKMKIKSSEFEEVKIIENAYAYDMRGNFIKTFNEEEFLRLGLNTDFKETYYSTSQNNSCNLWKCNRCNRRFKKRK